MHWSAPRLDPCRWERKFALWPTRIDDIRVWLEFYEERFVKAEFKVSELTGTPFTVWHWDRRHRSGAADSYTNAAYIP